MPRPRATATVAKAPLEAKTPFRPSKAIPTVEETWPRQSRQFGEPRLRRGIAGESQGPSVP